MARLTFITHPEVVIDPDTPITEWGLSETGQRRASAFAQSEHFADVTDIWSSSERKARDTAAILSAPHNLPVRVDPDLGENDRSATGFLPRDAFEAAADAFFAQPDTSFRAWETALAAQARIQRAIDRLLNTHTGRDLAVVSHGAVGTLLWCALMGHPIDRKYDQPGQGHFWMADLETLKPMSGWQSIG